jgi:hypothetical protein
MAHGEVVVAGAGVRVPAQLVREIMVSQEPGESIPEGFQVRGVVDEEAVHAVDDLIADAADRTGDDRPRFPHCFGYGQTKALDEALLHDHGRCRCSALTMAAFSSRSAIGSEARWTR